MHGKTLKKGTWIVYMNHVNLRRINQNRMVYIGDIYVAPRSYVMYTHVVVNVKKTE